MRYFVTGGTGFIGAYVVRDLVREGHEVTAYDAAPDRWLLDELLGADAGRVEVVRGDVTDMAHLLRAMQQARPERLVHLVSLLTNASEWSPLRTVKVNIEGTIHAFEVAAALGVQKVVWASSMAVFGYSPTPRGHIPNDAPHTPTNLYGAAKSFLESTSEVYRRDRGLDTVGLRFSVVYGYGKSGTLSRGGGGGYLEEFIDKPAAGQPGVLADGEGIVNLLHIEDASRAVLLAAAAPPTPSAGLIIRGEDFRLADVAALVRELLPDAAIEVRNEGQWRYVDGLDGSAADSEIGFRPEIPLRDGLTRTFNALREKHGLPLIA